MPAAQQALYKSHAQRLFSCFLGHHVAACTGAQQLANLELADKMGHVSVASKNTVFHAYTYWASKTCALSPNFPEGWVARWSVEHDAFWYYDVSSKERTWQKPPCGRGSWYVQFDQSFDRFFFLHDELGVWSWELPSWEDVSDIPTPWLLSCDELGMVRYWNSALQRFSVDSLWTRSRPMPAAASTWSL